MTKEYNVSKIESESLLNSHFSLIEIAKEQKSIHYGKKCFPLDGKLYTYTKEMKEQIIKEAGDYNVRSLPDIDADLQALKNRLKGLSIDNGILKLKNESTGIIGIHLENVIKIDNKNDGTNSNLCLESSDADYLIKEAPFYIDVNDAGLDDEHDIQYTLNENGTCSARHYNLGIGYYSLFKPNSVVRRVSDQKIFKITSIEESGFRSAVLFSIDSFPSTLITIQKNAFGGAGELKVVDCRYCIDLKDIGTDAFKGCINCILQMTQELATSLGDRIVNGKIDDAVVEIVNGEEIL